MIIKTTVVSAVLLLSANLVAAEDRTVSNTWVCKKAETFGPMLEPGVAPETAVEMFRGLKNFYIEPGIPACIAPKETIEEVFLDLSSRPIIRVEYRGQTILLTPVRTTHNNQEYLGYTALPMHANP